MDKPNRYFKILLKEEHEQFLIDTEFKGSKLDLKDGFIHLAFEDQIYTVINNHFKGIKDLFILEIDPKGYNIEIENDYPHFYNDKLVYSSVKSVEHIDN